MAKSEAVFKTLDMTPSDETIPYLQMGSAFFIGLAIGYTLKKSFKIMLIVAGIAFIALFVLESQGAVSVDETILQKSTTEYLSHFQALFEMLKSRVQKIGMGSGASAIAGFFVGIKMG